MSTLASRPAMWAGLTLAGIAAVVGLKLTDAIDQTTGFILLLACLVPAWMATRAAAKAKAACASPAALTYNRRMIASGLGYVLGLGIAISVYDRVQPGPAVAFMLALLPVIPIFGMIRAMVRYLVEEQDEYLRYRAARASLTGLAVLLGVASFWGFLETFELAPHAEGWWAFPVWAVGMGLAQCWMTLQDRAGGSAEDGQ